MSIPEAARLVIKSGTLEDGKIFVLDMGQPVKISDLAKNMIKLNGYHEDEIKIVYTDLRKGEKLNEELVYTKEDLIPSKFGKLFISNEDSSLWSMAEINEVIDKLRQAAETYYPEKIKSAIKYYLPEYSYIPVQIVKKSLAGVMA